MINLEWLISLPKEELKEELLKVISTAWLYAKYKPKLKPCPFCGHVSAPDIVEESKTRIHVSCRWIDGGCGARTMAYKTKKKAVDAWNMRAGE